MRQKVQTRINLSSWQEVDRTLREIAKLDAQIVDKETKYNAQIQDLRDRAETEIQPLQQAKARLERDIQEFCEFHREDFTQKSKALNFGIVGFRISTVLTTLARWTWKKVLEKLQDAGKVEFIRIKKSVDKEAIRQAGLNNEELRMYGMKLEQKESFWYEVNYEKIKNTANEH